MKLTQQQADAFARMPLTYLRQEYPNHIMHLLNDDGDVLPPRELHPIFYGCFDWHSAVHGYWLLLRCVRLYPELPRRNDIIALIDATRDVVILEDGQLAVMHPDHIDYFDAQGNPAPVKTLEVVVGRPTHVRDDQTPEFTYSGGMFRAPLQLAPGLWNIRLTATAPDGTVFRQRIDHYHGNRVK